MRLPAAPDAAASETSALAEMLRKLPQTPSAVSSTTDLPTVDVATERLAQRLRSKGGSVDDWALLARSYAELGHAVEARDAYDHALQGAPDNALLRAEREGVVARAQAGQAAK